ncbi:hypothetical protein DFH06DRAFT_573579 [Mycena polygramma]|nr:hypothetical protein DFH06DRAFT_573579 [Mycena polygramma]
MPCVLSSMIFGLLLAGSFSGCAGFRNAHPLRFVAHVFFHLTSSYLSSHFRFCTVFLFPSAPHFDFRQLCPSLIYLHL